MMVPLVEIMLRYRYRNQIQKSCVFHQVGHDDLAMLHG